MTTESGKVCLVLRCATLAVALLVAALAGAARAGAIAEADAAVRRGDYATALRLITPLAERGSASAQYNLGLLYERGLGVPQDFVEAARWIGKAADQGFPKAQLALGNMHSLGLGVPRDWVQAYKWFNLAASRFPAAEAKDRDLALKLRDRVAAAMTPEETAKAQKLVREWKPKSARHEVQRGQSR
ncbi:MAG: tetratricopeptide repeat protein [Candidatus Binatia bacterium]